MKIIISKIIAEVASKEGLIRRIKNLRGLKLDFSEEFLKRQSVGKLKHMYLAALIVKRYSSDENPIGKKIADLYVDISAYEQEEVLGKQKKIFEGVQRLEQMICEQEGLTGEESIYRVDYLSVLKGLERVGLDYGRPLFS